MLKPADSGQLTCMECEDTATCEICDSEDPKMCKRCIGGLLLHNGKCVGGCPAEWKDNSDKTACIPRSINDMGILPFPFLIAAFFGCLIALFGQCKKSTRFASQKQSSSQNTITCFIVIIAFIQFLALIALIVWSLLFGTNMLFFAGCIMLGLLIFLNIGFQYFYSYTFNRQFVKEDKVRKFKEGLLTKAQLKKFLEPSD